MLNYPNLHVIMRYNWCEESNAAEGSVSYQTARETRTDGILFPSQG